jgi:hypothetical protein
VRVIFSGGQTGVDRAAWDAAMKLGIQTDGWVPRGRISEAGPIPHIYQCREHASHDYPPRTEANCRDTAATLIVGDDDKALGRGAMLAIAMAKKHKKLLFISRVYRANDAANQREIACIRRWLAQLQPETLNVAGPRESRSPGIQERATAFLVECFRP